MARVCAQGLIHLDSLDLKLGWLIEVVGIVHRLEDFALQQLVGVRILGNAIKFI